MCLCVIRIRGTAKVPKAIKDTLKMLNLTRTNHATLITNSPSYLGMLKKVKDYVTWGEISQENLLELLRKRGEIARGKKLTEENIKRLGFDSFEDLALALYKGHTTLNKLRMKPVFRLHPPSGGFKRSVLKPYVAGGELGYRGKAMNKLLKHMI